MYGVCTYVCTLYLNRISWTKKNNNGTCLMYSPCLMLSLPLQSCHFDKHVCAQTDKSLNCCWHIKSRYFQPCFFPLECSRFCDHARYLDTNIDSEPTITIMLRGRRLSRRLMHRSMQTSPPREISRNTAPPARRQRRPQSMDLGAILSFVSS